jgi:SAM-dependent methyltransferase
VALATRTAPVLNDTRIAFDSVAADYDRSNTANPLLSAMRQRVMDAVCRWLPAGSHVLDLGCGPGTDHEGLTRAGYRITAIDWSPAMVSEARRRALGLSADGRIQVHQLGIQELDRLPPGPYDGACSNFGPLNCVPDLRDAARQIAAPMRPGGVLVASVIGRVVPWELALYGMRADWTRARVRFARDFVEVPLNGGRVWTRYYTPAEFEAPFRREGFTRVALRTLGLFVPPPYLDGFAGRHPRLVRALQRLEDGVGGWPGVRCWGDYFLIVLRKR